MWFLYPSPEIGTLCSGPRSKLAAPSDKAPSSANEGLVWCTHAAAVRHAGQACSAGQHGGHGHTSPAPPRPDSPLATNSTQQPATPPIHSRALTFARASRPTAPSSDTSPRASTRTPSAHLAASTREILPGRSEVGGGGGRVRKGGAGWGMARQREGRLRWAGKQRRLARPRLQRGTTLQPQPERPALLMQPAQAAHP